jgi:hypothetical protein
MKYQILYDELVDMEIPIQADTEEEAREILGGYIGGYQAYADYIKLVRVEERDT